MAKRGGQHGFSRRGAPAGGMGGGMLKQLQQLQEEMVKTQEALGDETLSVTAGGGAIEVVITGHQRIQSITIDPEVVDPEDVEMLEDLIVAAIKQARERAQELSEEEMSKATRGLLPQFGGGLKVPGLGM